MSEEIKKEVKVSKNNQYLMPGAIIIAGLIIAGAVFLTQGSKTAKTTETKNVSGNKLLEEEVLPITDEDHVFGSRDADVFLIEYSDYKCGYCGLFHSTIEDVIKENDGRVAWVYRHTPYQPGGKELAVASECVAELAGEDAFWAFTNDIFANQKFVSDKWVSDEIAKFSVDNAKFKECLSSDKYDSLISKHVSNAQGLGGNGTPYNVILTKDGGVIKFSGAQPKERVDIFVNRALNSIK
jgi:protein-disulfide isomerase